MPDVPLVCVFFLNGPAPLVIYTLSLHDALPISSPLTRRRFIRSFTRSGSAPQIRSVAPVRSRMCGHACRSTCRPDRKSTRLNSSHRCISYAVFCLKKKKKNDKTTHIHLLVPCP